MDAGSGPESHALALDAAAEDAAPEQAAPEDAGPEEEPMVGPTDSPECMDASDCDDRDPCTGVYDCVAGQCTEVRAACVNPDPQHCEARCDRDSGGACVIAARDADGDGYGDAACAAGSGRAGDCDDGADSVHPGASELCDGLDNDCNGLTDLEDGFPLTGTTRRVALGLLPVSASSSEGTFGAAYSQGGGHVAFHSFTLKGADYFGQHLVAPLEPLSAQVVPAIAWGSDAFGLAWSRNGTVRFLALDRGGVALNTDAANDQTRANVNPADVQASWTSVAPLDAGQWLVVYAASQPAQLFARTVSSQNVLGEPRELVRGQFDAAPQLVGGADGVAAVWTRSVGAEQYVE